MLDGQNFKTKYFNTRINFKEQILNDNKTAQIMESEARLKNAMINSDLRELDILISSELVFTTHLGQLINKQDDLAAHKSGLFKIEELLPSDQRILFVGDTAIVSVRMQLYGSYNGSPSNGSFRFTRVWALSSDGNWKVVAGHSSIVA